MRSSRRSSASRGPRIALTGLIVAIGLTAGACTSGATPSPAATVTVSGAWIRAAAKAGAPTAAYLVITNAGGQADALIGASSPAAGMVEIHQTTTDTSGMTGMHPVARIDVPAGATVRLEPGGFHIMMPSVSAPLVAGQTVELDLVFEHAGKVIVQADVRVG